MSSSSHSILKRLLALTAGGLALGLSYAPFPFRFLAFFGLIPLLWVIEDVAPKRAFLWGWAFGTIAAGFHFFWLWFLVVPVEPVTRFLLNFGVVLLFGYLGLYFGLLAVAVKRLGVWAAVLAWPVLEFAKAQLQIAFPWDLLGYTMTPWTPFIQLASVGGVYLVSGWLVLVNVLICLLLRSFLNPRPKMTRSVTLSGGPKGRSRMGLVCPQSKTQNPKSKILALSALLLVSFLLPLAFSALRVKPNRSWFNVAILQPDVSPLDKGDRRSYEKIQSDLLRLTREAAQSKPDLIIYPETATLYDVTANSNIGKLVRALSDSLGIEIFTGTPLCDQTRGTWHNGAALIRPGEDSARQRYYKMRLVPFSEKIPYADEVPLLRKLIGTADMGNWDRGRSWTVFRFGTEPPPGPDSTAKSAKDATSPDQSEIQNPKPKIQNPSGAFSALICFEAIFPDMARRFCNLGAEMLVVVTNDGWFGRVLGSSQHFELAVMRTVENGVPMCRSANNGISAVIDPYGRIIARTPLFQQRILAGPVPAPIAPTIYRRFGDWYILASLLGLIALVVLRLVRRRAE